VAKITLRIERHYGNKELKTIIEDLVSIKFLNFKLNNEKRDKSYYKIDTCKAMICQEDSRGE
jgi:hypothetical protein